MEGNLAIWAMIWWIFAIINIVFCVLTRKRYKKVGWKGAGKRIILSWVIILCGIMVGSMIAAAVDSRDPMTTMAVTFGIANLSGIIAIIYTGSAANKAKAVGCPTNSTDREIENIV